MKKILLLGLILLTGLSTLNAQNAPAKVWDKTFGGSDDDVARRIEKTADGGYLIAGKSSSMDGDVIGNHATDPDWLTSDIWVVKLDADMRILWSKALGGSWDEDVKDMKVTPDGGAIILGYTYSYDGDVVGNHSDPDNFSGDAWAIKLDSLGNKEWTRCLGGSLSEILNSVAVTAEGEYIMVGGTDSTDGDVITPIKGQTDIWIVKMDDLGNVRSSKTYGGTKYDDANSVDVLTNGNYVVTAHTYSSDGDIATTFGTNSDSDTWVAEFNPMGEIVWQKTIGGTGMDKAWKLLVTPDNGILLGGYAMSEDGNINIPNNTNSTDFWVMKLDSNRNIQWQKKHGGYGKDNLFSMTLDTDGYLLIGSTNSGNLGEGAEFKGEFDQLIIKIDLEGELMWMKTLGGSTLDSAESIIRDHDGNYLVAGITNSIDGDVTNSYGFGDFWIVKLNRETLEVTDSPLSGVKIYPNPVQDVLTVSNDKNISRISLVDLSGRTVLTKTSSSKTEILNVAHLPKGVYLLGIEAEGQKKAIKIIKK